MPTTVIPGGTSVVTTAPAPTIAPAHGPTLEHDRSHADDAVVPDDDATGELDAGRMLTKSPSMQSWAITPFHETWVWRPSRALAPTTGVGSFEPVRARRGTYTRVETSITHGAHPR
jgi:hypothetical protein